MVSTTFVSAFVAASLLAMTTAQAISSSSILLIPTPTAKLPLNAMSTLGCYKTGVPLEDHGPYDFQSTGNCQGVCVGLKKPVMGLTDGTNCWCGDYLPPADAQVDDTECDTDCSGFDKEKCGGPRKWLIILSGSTKNRIDHWDPSSASSSSSAVTSAAQATSAPAKTVVVTPSELPSEKPKSSGPNKAGIAAGVVVGVVVLVGIVAGVLLVLRRRRRRAVEEEYRRQAAVNSFVSGNKLHTSNSSMTDSRLDPEFMMRRQSNGSIADNEDYSRRILKVTNPDGH
jgi:cell wall integrity and stress response component